MPKGPTQSPVQAGATSAATLALPNPTKAAGAPPEPATEAMTIQTANALITGAVASDTQLHAARLHFAALEAALSVSGPRFANARAHAAELHNTAIRRLRELAHERRQRALLQEERESGLVEIEI